MRGKQQISNSANADKTEWSSMKRGWILEGQLHWDADAQEM